MRKRDLAAAQRGLIVQRVLVDHWTPKEAGLPFGVDERQVVRLVAAYQRHGMAALRGAVGGGLLQWLETCLEWTGAWPSGGGKATVPVARRTSFSPDEPIRRGRWN